MLIKKIVMRAAGVSLAATVLLTAHPLRAQSSDSARIEKLERAVELLEKQNADLKAEVNSLQRHEAPAAKVTAEGPTNTELNYDGKTYVEKTVPLEKSSGYKGFPGFTFTAGRMPNPMVSTRLVWDPDINTEGLAEQWKHTFVFGAEPPPPPSFSKDEKAVVAPKPPEPFLKLDLFANFAQFVYDDANPENPIGPRATTTANGRTQLVPNTDAFLLAWQVGARLNFPHNFYFQLAPTLYNYTGNGDTFNVHYVGGDPHLTNADSLATNQTGINSLLVFDMPAEFGWKAWGIPMRIFTDFATNFEADERADAAGQPGQGSQRYAYLAGIGS